MYVTMRYEEWRGLGRGWFVAGGVFLGVGVVLMYQLVSGAVHVPGMEQTPLWLGPAVGLPAVLLGAALMSFRTGTVVDAGTRNACRWWGFGKPWKRRFYPLAHYRFLTVRPVYGEDEDSPEPHYAVSLLNEYDQGIDVYTSSDYWAARREAGDLARMLQMPVHDHSGEEEAVLKPGERHVSLRARLLGAGDRPPYPPRPPECRVTIQFTGEEADMDVPRAGLNSFTWFLLATGAVALLGSLGYSAWVVFATQATLFTYIFVGALLVAGVGLGGYLVLYAVRSAVLKEHIGASPIEVSVRRHGLLRETSNELPVEDIEHVDVSGEHVRVIGPEGRALMAGSTLEENEREWVRDMIRHVITAPSRKKGGTSFY